jgi:hypothetical protein
MAHRDKSQSPEFTVGIDAKRTFVDKRSRPNLLRMTPERSKRGHYQSQTAAPQIDMFVSQQIEGGR